MSNLSNIMQNGDVQTAEPQVFESMTESDQAALLYIAALEAAEEDKIGRASCRERVSHRV